jgi:hypothetical protein
MGVGDRREHDTPTPLDRASERFLVWFWLLSDNLGGLMHLNVRYTSD